MRATSFLGRLGGALLLKKVGETGRMLALFFCLFLAVSGWYGSPVFMEHFATPAPGTAPRYTGTIRVDDERHCGPRGCLPPRYWIQTSAGEIEFHCGYQPRPQNCWPSIFPSFKPDPRGVYVIGYDPYWGVDYIQFPPELAFHNDRNEPARVNMWRVHYLRTHRTAAVIFLLTLTAYVWLGVLSFKRD